jgi:hypothetical protein
LRSHTDLPRLDLPIIRTGPSGHREEEMDRTRPIEAGTFAPEKTEQAENPRKSRQNRRQSMYVTMQGNWSVKVKFNEGFPPQRFIISGAASGNGTYTATAGTTVNVVGSMWTINIQHNPGSGFCDSYTRIKFPTLSGGKYSFDIESNDDKDDLTFDDLILTCSTPNTGNEYIMYGNITCYTDLYYINPRYPGWLVIETSAALQAALKNPMLAKVIKQLYPERIPPVIINPNPPPDPVPFKPIMINLSSTSQAVGRVVDIFDKMQIKTEAPAPKAAGKRTAAAAAKAKAVEETLAYKLHSSVALAPAADVKHYDYDLAAIAQLRPSDLVHLCIDTLPFITLCFTDYDRTYSELHGGAYTGTGDRDLLGYAITDMNGNYIFRFTLPQYEQDYDSVADVALGEDQTLAYRPDMIVGVPGSNPPSSVLFETAPYWNIPNLCLVNICMPCSKVTAPSFCFNGNLIGGLGNVELGGAQNTIGSTAVGALDRNSYGNHLHPDGTVSVQITANQAGFHATNACWFGLIDVKGCMYNLTRLATDPMISHYTIRFKKPGGAWQWVSEAYTHPRFSKRFIVGYTGDPVGPFPMTLNVDTNLSGTPTPQANVPAYKNIQKAVYHDSEDWEFTDLDRFMQLSSSIYEAGAPGTVYFMVEGYDAAGNLVPGARDLIALFIDNSFINYSLDDVWFNADGINIIKAECNLYRMKDASLNAPLYIKFKANDSMGFIDSYTLGFSKCGAAFSVVESIPGISSGTNPTVADTVYYYVPYRGTAEWSKFGDANSHTIDYTPASGGGKWLNPGESFTMLYVSLYATKRQTNGYNQGLYGTSGLGTVVAVERLP